MFITKTRSKNTTVYYLVKSFKHPDTGKTTTKTIERIGNTEELTAKLGSDVDLQKWLKDYAKKRTAQDKDANNPKVNITFNKNSEINRKNIRLKNAGYVYIKRVCKELGLDKICKDIANNENLDIDIYDVFCRIIYNIILDSGESNPNDKFSKSIMEEPKYSYRQVIKSLGALAKHSVELQSKLYKNLKRKVDIDSAHIFYHCSNYSLINYRIYNTGDIDFPEDIVTLTKMFFDGMGFPCMFITENNVNKKYSDYIDVDKFLEKNFSNSVLYILPQSINTLTDNVIFDRLKTMYWITSQQVDKLNKETLNWAIDPSGWRSNYEKGLFNIHEVDKKIKKITTPQEQVVKLRSQMFYKYKTINIPVPGTPNSANKKLIITYNYELKDLQRTIRENTINSSWSNGSISNQDISVEIQKSCFDGFYAVYIDSDASVLKEVVNVITTKLEQVDYMLRFIQSEFVVEGILPQEDMVTAHYLSTFVSLTVFKYMSYRLNNSFTNLEIVDALRDICFLRLGSEGWVPVYAPNEICDALKQAFNVDFDKEYITAAQMRKLLK